MAVGLPEVAQGTAGTGLAWMGPNSSFDPVQFAADSYNVQAKADAEKKKAEKDAWKLIDLKPEDQYNIDNIDDTVPEVQEIQSYFTEKVKNKGGWDFETEAEAKKRTSEFGLDQKRKNNQYVKGTEYNKLLDADKGKEFNDAKMRQNYSIYVAPEKFVGTPGFQPYEAEYTKLVEKYKKDPYYSKNPERAIAKARLDFRDKYEGDLLQTYLKPESLGTIIKNNEDALLNTITTDQEYGNVTIKEVSNDRNQRTVKFSDGRIKYIDGTDKTATNLYNGDVDVKRSVKAHYEDLPDQDKEKYKGSQDPALEWWKDFVNSSAGDVTKSRNVSSSNVVNFGGGYSVETDWIPTDLSTTIKTTRDKANKIYGETDIDGFNVNKGENQLNLDKIVNAPIYYKSNDATQNAVPTNATSITLAGVKPFMAPTFGKDMTWESFEKELKGMTYDKPIIGKNGETIDNAYDEFLYNFGKKYANATKKGRMGGIILTKPEQAFLKKIGKGEYIVGGKFVSGEMSWTETNQKGEQVLKKEPSAIIPLAYVNGDIESVTKIDFNKALDKYKGKYNNNVTDFEYLKGSGNSKQNTTQNTKVEDDFEEVDISPTIKKTPFGKEYDSEDEKGYYFKGRMIEEKGR